MADQNGPSVCWSLGPSCSGCRRSAVASVPRRSYTACQRCSHLTTGSNFLLYPLSIGSHGPKLVSNVPPKLARKRRQLNPASMPLRTGFCLNLPPCARTEAPPVVHRVRPKKALSRSIKDPELFYSGDGFLMELSTCIPRGRYRPWERCSFAD